MCYACGDVKDGLKKTCSCSDRTNTETEFEKKIETSKTKKRNNDKVPNFMKNMEFDLFSFEVERPKK